MGALDGTKVVDLTRVLGGPYCTQWLGDHGADVIKIEPPQGDETRHWGPPFDEGIGAASYFIGVNRNKRGLALDLKQPQAREVLARLMAEADVLVENFKPGTWTKLGFDTEDFSATHPRLIHCRITGFGADGPYGGLPGYDAVIQAQAGLMSVNGEPGGEGLRLGIPLVDIGTGLSALAGIAMALYERERSGQGQFIDMTLFDCAVALMHPHAANHFLSGKRPGPTGN
ncbi:MAG: CoA transferase, partial [Pseudomonadota bacterium]